MISHKRSPMLSCMTVLGFMCLVMDKTNANPILNETTMEPSMGRNMTPFTPILNATGVSDEQSFNGDYCMYAPGLTVGDQTRRMECCNKTVRFYHRLWSRGNLYLTTYMQSLNAWECPQFEQECQERLFDITPFSSLVYDYFCNRTDFITKCFETVKEINTNSRTKTLNSPLSISNFSTSTMRSELNDDWKRLVCDLNSTLMTMDELLDPCIQVAFYDAEEEHKGDYVELLRTSIPGCQPAWCGFSGDTIRNRIISVWSCLSNDCRTNVIIIMVVCGLLAVVITFANLSVILVYFFNPNLLHSQGVYKVSLAFADIIVGLIVFPSFIGTLSRFTNGVTIHADYIDVTGYKTNGTLAENATSVQVRPVSGRFSDYFDRTYLDAVGFFTVLSLTVSIYCLATAGFDRLVAVYRPLSYRKDKAKKLAKYLCLVIWILGIIFAILPMFTRTLEYAFIASILVASGGRSALILFLLAFIIPLLVTWTVNIVTFHSTRKHARVRRHLTYDSKKKTDSIEVRLARTLSLMVGIFTLSLLPVAIVIIPSLFLSNISFSNPRRLNLQAGLAYNTAEFVSILILACNSLWNFFIYNGRNLEFRKGFKVVYKKIGYRLGLSQCCIRFVSCFQDIVHDGRRRISSLPNLSSTLGGLGKKTSLVPTSTTTITGRKSSTDILSSDIITHEKTIRNTNGYTTKTASSDKESSSGVDNSSRVLSETSLSSNSKDKKRQRKAEKGKDTKKGVDSSIVSEDSVFQSFAIDANADRLFESVMDQIDEEIEEVDLEKNESGKSQAK